MNIINISEKNIKEITPSDIKIAKAIEFDDLADNLADDLADDLQGNLLIDIEPINSIKLLKEFIQSQPNSNIYLEPDYIVNIDIIEYDTQLYLFFIDCVELATDVLINKTKIDKEFYKLLDHVHIWNFSICHGIMFNLPFTLGNIIYIPYKWIKKCQRNNDEKKLANTMIHEKLHVGQRLNEIVWTQYIFKNSPEWKKINKTDIEYRIIESELAKPNYILGLGDEEFVTNPDCFYLKFKYVLVDNVKNIQYYGHYVRNKKTKQMRIKFFIVNVLNKKLESSNVINNCEDHPYETFAYKIANELV